MQVIYMRTRNPEIEEDFYDYKGDLFIWDEEFCVLHDHDEENIPNDQVNINVNVKSKNIVRIGVL